MPPPRPTTPARHAYGRGLHDRPFRHHRQPGYHRHVHPGRQHGQQLSLHRQHCSEPERGPDLGHDGRRHRHIQRWRDFRKSKRDQDRRRIGDHVGRQLLYRHDYRQAPAHDRRGQHFNNVNGPFGNAASDIVLGDAATTTGNSSPSLLTGGTFTIGRGITVANQATTSTTPSAATPQTLRASLGPCPSTSR